jgi:prepilin-type processing-associated H-X9-DG protein
LGADGKAAALFFDGHRLQGLEILIDLRLLEALTDSL